MKLFIKKSKVKPLEVPVEIPTDKAEEKVEVPAKATYEDTHVLERLQFLITIVNEGQDSAIVKILMDNNTSVAFSSHGKGTASSDLYEVFGLSNNNKHVIFSIIKESAWPAIKEQIKGRFA